MQSSHQLAGSVARVNANLATASGVTADAGIKTFALQWFEQMRTGKIDRTQLEVRYSAQLTEEAVQGMSQYIKAFDYGASPVGAEIVRTHSAGEQTFRVVKLIFPRGDAASLLFGFNRTGKITGITLLAMAGD